MIHICTHFGQLSGLIEPLTEHYVQQIAIHVGKMQHRDVLCCEYAEMMHDGSHPNITIIYIPPELEAGARIRISQLRAYFPNQEANNDDDEFIFTCPGYGTPFSQQ